MPSAAPRGPRREQRQRDSTSPGFGGGCARKGLEGPGGAGRTQQGGAGGGGRGGRGRAALPGRPLQVEAAELRHSREARGARVTPRGWGLRGSPGIPSRWPSVCLHQKAVWETLLSRVCVPAPASASQPGRLLPRLIPLAACGRSREVTSLPAEYLDVRIVRGRLQSILQLLEETPSVISRED